MQYPVEAMLGTTSTRDLASAATSSFVASILVDQLSVLLGLLLDRLSGHLCQPYIGGVEIRMSSMANIAPNVSRAMIARAE